jgi:Uma2 family endonuclease
MNVPETMVAELIAGELIASPRPALEHSQASSILAMDLGGPFDRGRGGPGGWWIRYEPELHWGADVLVPDLAGWRRSRCPEPPSGPHTSVVPDCVCEVLSPSTTSVDRMKKMPVYLREGVTHVWLVDPANRALEVFRRDEGRWVLAGNFGGIEKVWAEPFEAVELELAALWPQPLAMER